MKTAEEISNDAAQLEEPLNDYSLLELHLFITLKALYKQFYNNQISKDQGSKLKILAMNNFYNKAKQYELEKESFKKFISDIRKTELLRSKLRFELKDKSINALDTAIELIEIYSGEGNWK